PDRVRRRQERVFAIRWDGCVAEKFPCIQAPWGCSSGSAGNAATTSPFSLIHKQKSLDSLRGRDYRGFQCEIVGFRGVYCVFQGETAITVDDKGRLAIPTAYRELVAGACAN